MKKLIISHGDKGGVGKSIYAMLVTDYLLDIGRSVAVVEGDVQIGDVGKRYEGVAGVVTMDVDLDKSGRDAENSIAMLFRHVEQMGCETVVINSPANAKKALDTNAELILPVAQDLGFEVCVAWMVGIEEASAEMSGKSVICEMADRKIAVVNRHESEYDADFAWFTDKKHQAAWVKSGGLVGEIPELASRVASKLKEHKGRSLASLAGPDSPLHIVDRQVIKNWLRKSWASAVAPLINGGE
ncbi:MULTISPECIES: hypothetical protein [Acidithiobacillus]|uniref:Mobilization protein MobD n=2 Tax=Acidithiobacillus TaxID=119977 RepID=A0A179B859_ACIFR|nr:MULTISPECIES: hypothetical protein [Acidithiobacillus]MEB8486756.1 hypothetical protein [Acidithiobacillus ferriphilus]MEB8488639.1 hypothetical protein [Acidithiobacillus ferriphilus]MEB8493282.1 hypothetical protein [Acidithiobacillus ferriphilus]MEB8513695.1 hypothetical protein [Acidithiobacillus ferriphilus]MEB8522708.1 hypothetical protein [Acidithiobacillus ferriphilus]